MIHPDTIEEVRNRMDIVEVIGDFVSLKRAGRNYKAKSPFTNEKTPSFFVVPGKEIFKDFSSGKGGDAFTFLMEHEGLDYVGAVRYLAQKYGVEVKETHTTDRDMAARHTKSSLYELMNFAQERYRHSLFHHREGGLLVGLDYAQKRGITREAIEAFGLGYAPEAWAYLLEEARRKGYSDEALEKAGLIIVRENKTPYDRFRKRLLFPIRNLSGQTIAFGGRILTDDNTQPKYINSPETEIYRKSGTLYGLFQAKNEIRKNDICYLVEGYTDVVSLHQAGFTNVVSSLGTAITREQIALIGRFTRHITILFDGDTAGIKAALRGVALILEEGLDVHVVVFPEGVDPDGYLSKVGADRFRHFLQEESKDFISFKTDFYLNEAAGDPIRKAEAIGEIVDDIACVPDMIKQAVYVRQVAAMLDLEEAVLRAELQKKITQRQKRSVKPSLPSREKDLLPSSSQPVAPVSATDTRLMVQRQERETIRLLLNYADHKLEDQLLHSFICNELEGVNFINPVYREIYTLFAKASAQGESIDSGYLIKEGSESVKAVVAELITPLYNTSEHWQEKYHIYFPKEEDILEKVAYTNLLRLKMRLVQHMAQENRKKIKQVEKTGNIDELDTLLTHQIGLDEARQKLANYLGIVVVQ